MKILLLFLVLIVTGCFGGVPSSDVRKEALSPKYSLYLENQEERNKVDNEWLESNKKLDFGFLPHPYGDESLLSYGIIKKKNHKYSKY
jgi:hypothetical protein